MFIYIEFYLIFIDTNHFFICCFHVFYSISATELELFAFRVVLKDSHFNLCQSHLNKPKVQTYKVLTWRCRNKAGLCQHHTTQRGVHYSQPVQHTLTNTYSVAKGPL